MFFLGGVVSIVLVSYFKSEREKFKYWKKGRAVVLDVSCDTLIDSAHLSFYPKYKYSYEGTEYIGISSTGVRANTYKAGDVIYILINPANTAESDAPHYFKIGRTTFTTFDIGVTVFTIISILCFAVGIVSAILI